MAPVNCLRHVRGRKHRLSILSPPTNNINNRQRSLFPLTIYTPLQSLNSCTQIAHLGVAAPYHPSTHQRILRPRITRPAWPLAPVGRRRLAVNVNYPPSSASRQCVDGGGREEGDADKPAGCIISYSRRCREGNGIDSCGLELSRMGCGRDGWERAVIKNRTTPEWASGGIKMAVITRPSVSLPLSRTHSLVQSQSHVGLSSSQPPQQPPFT